MAEECTNLSAIIGKNSTSVSVTYQASVEKAFESLDTFNSSLESQELDLDLDRKTNSR